MNRINQILFLLLILSGCLDIGDKVQARFGVGQCFSDNIGQVFEVMDVMNKNYKYNEVETGKELIYPITIVDQNYKQVECH